MMVPPSPVYFDDRTEKWVEDDIQVRNLKDELLKLKEHRDQLLDKVYDLEWELGNGQIEKIEKLENDLHRLHKEFDRYKEEYALDKKTVQESIDDRAVYEIATNLLQILMIQNAPHPDFVRCWGNDHEKEHLPLMLRDFIVMVKEQG